MRSKTLEKSIIDAAGYNRGLWLPSGERTTRTWPLCMTCGREVEAAEIKNASTKGCDIWARCHGQEDHYHVSWSVPMRTMSEDVMKDKNVGWAIKRAMQDGLFFDPSHSDKGMVVVG